MIVADAGVAVAALLRPGPARDVLSDEQVHCPHLVDAEVASVLRRLCLSGELVDEVGQQCLTTWAALGVVRHPGLPLLPRMWVLRPNISAYDATYVALAESLGCALLTTDGRLARAPGPRCPVTVLRG